MFTKVFYWKFLYISYFTPFFSDFTPFLHTFFKIFFRSAHLLIHINLLEKKVSQYLQWFSNFGWGHDFVTPTTTNDKRRTTTLLRITITWVDKVPQAKKKERMYPEIYTRFPFLCWFWKLVMQLWTSIIQFFKNLSKHFCKKKYADA